MFLRDLDAQLLVAMPFGTSGVFFLVVPGATSSVLAPCLHLAQEIELLLKSLPQATPQG